MIYNSYDNVGLVRVLSFLKSHSSEYLSGQDLSDVLKVSRVAVWKHIKKIRQLGYKIDSKQKLGYKLVRTTSLMLPWEITDGLKTQFIGKRAYYFDIIDSTQNFASKIASNPAENGSVIIAQKQTGGKGRLGRRWLSPVGGIWLSVILHPDFEVSRTTLFPVAASLALAIAIEKTLKIKPKLKWPNDVTIHGKKVAGIVIDMSIESNEIENLILGVGINFKVDTAKLEKSLRKTENFYGVASLVENNNRPNHNSKQPPRPIKLVQSFLYELERVFYLLEQRKTNTIIKNWTRRSSTIGKITTVEISRGEKKLRGEAIKIDSDGALLINQKGVNCRVLAGDVSHVV